MRARAGDHAREELGFIDTAVIGAHAGVGHGDRAVQDLHARVCGRRAAAGVDQRRGRGEDHLRTVLHRLLKERVRVAGLIGGIRLRCDFTGKRLFGKNPSLLVRADPVRRFRRKRMDERRGEARRQEHCVIEPREQRFSGGFGLGRGVRLYRMQLASVILDGTVQPHVRNGAVTVGQGVDRVELAPEILNYTIQEPNVGYFLEGHDSQWTIVPQNNLNNIIYTNLPAGDYTFHLGIFDSSGEHLLEERKFELIKEGEFYERPGFEVYMLLLLSLFIIWFTWLIVQRQLNAQQIKINMANETVMAIANAVDAKDVRTHQHSTRVAEYSVLIAEEMHCFSKWRKNRELSNLKKAAQMHDIGKIAVPDSVLNKVGRLTDEEYAQMKSHVIRGAEILKDFTLVEHVEDGTKYHHERYDGKGYPDGLKGEEIPLFGRIISVADTFDAMTSNRVYRNHMDTDYVMNEMKRGRGTQFDPDALDAFLRLVDKKVIDLEKIYAQKRAEIQQADPKAQEELARRVEEDKKIQEAQMKSKEEGSGDKKDTSENNDSSKKEEGDKA